MDIERLMSDLPVTDLQRIYSELSVDLEDRKEELRQMVGRRYRDVLDASSTVRRVTQNADVFSSNVRDIRNALSDRSFSSNSALSRQQFIRLSALKKLYSLIGAMDPLSDTFVLLLVENIHRNLSAEVVRSTQGSALVRLMSPKLIRLRLALEKEFVDGLCDLSLPGETVNQLAAIALLKKLSVEELLKMFLESKMALVHKGFAGARSLIETVWHIRRTFECIQQLFLDGQLIAVLRFFCSGRWTPKAVERCINDEPLSFANCLRNEITLLGEKNSPLTFEAVNQDVLKAKCFSYLDGICAASRDMVKQKCSVFESTSDLLNFLTVLLEAFQEEWPVIGNSEVIYRKFFENLLLERFQNLMTLELSDAGHTFLVKISAANCHPTSLFKKRTTRYDPLLATGVSEQLVRLVEQFDNGLRCIYENVKKYETVGKEGALSQLVEQLANAVVEMVSNTCTAGDSGEKATTSSKAEHSLTMTRVYLALLRPRSSVISLCLSGNNDKISKCASLLRETAEKHFCSFLDALVEECVETYQVKKISEICFDSFTFLSYVQEYEKLDLPEVGAVDVPLQINCLLYDFLYGLCTKICAHSVSHMFTRRIRMYLNERLGNLLAGIYGEVSISGKPVISRIALQYLFDVRVLNCVLSSDVLRSLIAQFEGMVDPFDLSLISSPLAKNARIAAQRYSIVYGPHFGDTFTTKEPALSPSYTAVVDIVPRVPDIARFTLIPRLSKTTKEPGEPLRAVASAINISSRKKINRQGDGVRNTPSLSSLYNWFGK